MATSTKTNRIKSNKTTVRGNIFRESSASSFFKKPSIAVIFMLVFANVGVAMLLFASAASTPLVANFEAPHNTLVNNHRVANGRGALGRSKCLTSAARSYSQQLASTGVWQHSPGASYYAIFCPNATNSQFTGGYLGENIYRYDTTVAISGQQLAQFAFDGFKNSPEHNANMLSVHYHYVGYGAAYIKEGSWYHYYVTQIFVDCSGGCSSDWTSPPAEVSGTSGYITGVSVDLKTISGSQGYWTLKTDGSVAARGASKWYGDLAGKNFSGNIVDIASPDFGGGYWIVTSTGAIYAYGSATYYGGANNIHLAAPILGISSVPGGKGYWLLGSDGGIFSYGSARFYGSAGNLTLNKPIVDMAVFPSGGGYWLVASDGGIFSYGAAAKHFYGSMAGKTLNAPIVAMTTTITGNGYRLLGSDGGIFSFGSANFYGSAAGKLRSTERATGFSITADGRGYWIVTNQNRIFTYGDAVQ